MRVVMALGDGDDVAFSMPGYPQVLYRFLRTGGDVTVSVRRLRRRGPLSRRALSRLSTQAAALSYLVAERQS